MPPQELQQNPQPIPPAHERLSRVTMHILVGALVCAGILALIFALRDRATPEIQATEPPRDVFEGLVLEAESVLVWDAKTEMPIYRRDARRALPLASLSKLMTAIVAYEFIPEDATLSISADALANEGSNGLVLGERWERDALIEYTLVSSSNDAAAALAENHDRITATPATRFVDQMNTQAKLLGLIDTSFINVTGLDEPDGSVNRGSAYDVARLFAHVLATIPGLLDATRFEETTIASLDRTHTVTNTNTIAESVPWAIGGKTGFTDIAGGNLAMSFDVGIGHPIIIVVLGSTKEGRFADMEKLIDAARRYFDEV